MYSTLHPLRHILTKATLQGSLLHELKFSYKLRLPSGHRIKHAQMYLQPENEMLTELLETAAKQHPPHGNQRLTAPGTTHQSILGSNVQCIARNILSRTTCTQISQLAVDSFDSSK